MKVDATIEDGILKLSQNISFKNENTKVTIIISDEDIDFTYLQNNEFDVYFKAAQKSLESFKKMFETSLPSDLDSDNYSEKLKERERAFDFRREIRIEQGRVI